MYDFMWHCLVHLTISVLLMWSKQLRQKCDVESTVTAIACPINTCDLSKDVQKNFIVFSSWF